MKKFSKINGRVIAMRYDHGRKAVICASLQGRIIIYDEKDIEHCYPLRTFDEPYQHRQELSHVVLHEGGGLCATTAAESVEGIRFWASDQASIDSQLCTRGQVILNMGFLEPYPLLWVATSDGRIRIWGCPTRNEKTGKLDTTKVNGCCLLSFANRPPDGSAYEFLPEEHDGVKSPHQPRPTLYPSWRERREDCTYGEPTEYTGLPEGVQENNVPVAVAQFDAFSGHLYLGDELGNVRCFDLSLVIRLLQDGIPDAKYGVKTSKQAPLYKEAHTDLGDNWNRESTSGFYEPVFAADKIEEPWSEVEEILGEDWRSTFPEDTSNEEAICAPSALQNYHVLAPENIRAYEVKYRRASADDSPRNWQLEDILRSERRSVGGTDFLQGPAGAAPLLPSELARFCWSVEYAHEDAVLALVCARDPACVLTSGLDRCVRMWSHSGSFKGVLLQGYTPGMRSPFWSLEVDVAAREARDDAEAKRVAADLNGDSDSSQTPIVVAQLQEARDLDRDIQEPELSPRLAAVRGALSEIQAMGTVDVDDPILSPPGSPASSRRALTPKASVFTAASTGLFEGSSMLDSKPMTAASHVSVASRPKSSFDSITANLKKLPPEAQSALDELTQALHL
jgi:hypothetical protein